MSFWRLLFWILVLVNFGLRTALVFQVDTQPVFDFARYYQAAVSIAEGKGYVMFGRLTAFQGVGYPGFLAAFFSVFGPSVLLAKILNLGLSLIGAFLFYHVVRRFLPESATILAALIYLYLPKEIFYVNVLGSELLFNTLLLAFLACYFQSWSTNRRWMWLVAAGLILGFMSLVKPLSPVFGLVVVIGELVVFHSLRSWRKALIGIVTVAVVSIAVIAPWTYRNYKVFDAFVPITTNSGYVLYLSNNPLTKGGWMDPYSIADSPIYKVPYPESDPRFEAAMNKLMNEAGKKWILENPEAFFRLMINKFHSTFYTNWDWKWAFQSKEPLLPEVTMEAIERVTQVVHAMAGSFYFLGYPVFLLGAVTAAVRREDRERMWGLVLFGLPAFLMTLTTLVFEGNARYSFPAHSAIAVFTALGLLQFHALKDSFRNRFDD